MKDIIIAIVLLICAFLDMKYRKIPNYITMPFFLIGMIYTFDTFGIAGFGFSMINVLIVLLIFAYGFVKKYMGGGDLKLLLAIACWMETKILLIFIVATLIIGAIISIFKMIFDLHVMKSEQKVKINRMEPFLIVERLKKRSGKKMAYAVPIFIGFLVTQLIKWTI